MLQTVNTLINDYVSAIRGIYGSHVREVILYGSYARGDYTKDSDVDIMLLVDLPDEQIERFSDRLSELGFEYNIRYGVWFMPTVKNIEHFHYWTKAYPFYSNVANEGVLLYHAA